MSWLDRIDAGALSAARTTLTVAAPKSRSLKSFSVPPFWSDGASIVLDWALGQLEAGGVGYQEMATLLDHSGIMFSCIAARMRVFGQGRFAWQRYAEDGRPAGLYSTPELALFRRPWANGTGEEWFGRLEMDGSLAGNSFWTLCDQSGRLGKAARADDGRFLSRLLPHWTRILVDAPSGHVNGPDARVIGFLYRSGGKLGEPWAFTPDEVCHFSPIPDPKARYRGMSWVTPVLRSIRADQAMTEHTVRFLRKGATPAIAVKMPPDVDDDEFDAFVEKFNEMYGGLENAGSTVFLQGGADVTPLTFNFKDLDLGAMQSKVETRIAMAAGVHPSILAAQAGMEGSALNAGNFEASRRIYVDANIRGLWACAAASAESLVTIPDVNSQLVVDTRDIPFLRDSAKDEAEVMVGHTTAINSLITSGYDPDASVEAVISGDLARLRGQHSGWYSVQLQRPGQPSGGDPVGGDDGDDGEGSDAKDDAEVARFAAETVQKVYLGVPTVVSQEEARDLVRRSGANLGETAPAPPREA